MIGRATDGRRAGRLADAVRSTLWPVPLASVSVAVALGVGLPRLDARVADQLPESLIDYLFTGGPGAARSVLETIAGSLITVTSLTFSLTVVTLQLASSQFSPRLLRTFTRDRYVHVTLALFLATFTYALTVLRTVRAADERVDAFVPQLSVTLSFILTLASVVALVLFLAHLARAIRIEMMLRNVHQDSSATYARVLPRSRHDDGEPGPLLEPPSNAVPLPAPSSGFVVRVDGDTLLRAARDAGAVVLFDRCVGEFVVAGTPAAMAWPLTGTTPLDAARLDAAMADAVRTGPERTVVEDIAFGLRQLTDVAAKALSPGVNDPTTAVHALGHAAALLCELTGRELGPEVLSDSEGEPRVLLRRPELPELLELVLGPTRRYGADDPDVLARVFWLLREVAWVTERSGHRRAVIEQLARLRETVDQQHRDAADRARLADLGQRVEDAVAGRWSATAAG